MILDKKTNELESTLKKVFKERFPDLKLTLACSSSLDHTLAMSEEKALSTTWAPARQEEFLSGRTCARHAMRNLGYADAPILRHEDRSPIWPHDLRGSISHIKNCILAIVSDDEKVKSIGIDVAYKGSIQPHLIDSICTPEECANFSERQDDWPSILFSLKESLYKCVHPLNKEYFDFLDVSFHSLQSSSNHFTTAHVAIPDNTSSYYICFEELIFAMTLCLKPQASTL